MTNAEKIQAWCDEHEGEAVTESVLLDILGLDTLVGADLSNADLHAASLANVDMSDANLSGADMSWANVESSCFDGVVANGVNFSNARMAWSSFREATVPHAKFTNAGVYRLSLARADARCADFSNVAYRDIDFRWTLLEDADF